MLKKWKLTIEYDGSSYAGWQRQKNVLSAQQVLEEAIFKFCQKNISVTAAGRTDSGVHAAGQVVHFELDYGDRRLEPYELIKAINAHMRGAPIAVVKAENVDPDFNARFHAKNKLYRYRIVSRLSPPVMDIGQVWHVRRDLDFNKMKKASEVLIGHHDFTSFRASECQAKNPVRTLSRLDITSKKYDEFGGVEYQFELEAQSFLHHMCRNIVGTLVEVGKGKRSVKSVGDALIAKDRKEAGMTAPPDGLTLVRIDY